VTVSPPFALSSEKLRTMLGSKGKTPTTLPSFSGLPPTSSFDFSLLDETEQVQSTNSLQAIPWTYTERQQSVKALIDAAPDGSTVIIGYGGAVGGGKTFLEAGLAAEIALDGRGSEVLVGRQDYVDLKDTTLRQFDRMTLELPYRRKYDSSPTFRELSKDGGRSGRVTFRGLEDWESLMSAEYGAIFIEEAHEVPLNAVLGLLSRLRHPAARVYVMLVCFNPLGGWPERWFMKGELPEEVEQVDNLHIHFVPAKMRDNPYLPQGYEQVLRAMYPAHMVQKLIDGEPGGVENAAYPQFERGLHVATLTSDIRFMDGAIGVDYGRRHKSAAVAVSVDQYGRRWVREAWGEPSGDHGADLLRQIGRMRRDYAIRRARVDPNQDVLAGQINGALAKGAEGSRQHRITLTGRLFNVFQGGRVPRLLNETRLAIQHGPYMEPDTPGLLLVRGAPGIADLCEEIEAYHFVEKVTDTKDEQVIARINDDLVAALEYAIEELDEPDTPDYLGALAQFGRMANGRTR
jgi:terminase large subunit-like protein